MQMLLVADIQGDNVLRYVSRCILQIYVSVGLCGKTVAFP